MDGCVNMNEVLEAEYEAVTNTEVEEQESTLQAALLIMLNKDSSVSITDASSIIKVERPMTDEQFVEVIKLLYNRIQMDKLTAKIHSIMKEEIEELVEDHVGDYGIIVTRMIEEAFPAVFKKI